MLSREEREQLARSFHQELVDTVAARTSSAPELVQDACQHAWMQLERSPPANPENVRGWLFTVACHHLYRLSQREGRELSLDALADSTPSAGTELPNATAPSPEQLAEQHEDLALLAELPVRQQRILVLQAAGFDYGEISQRLGITTRTVERQVLRGRANLRALRAERDRPAPSSGLRAGQPPVTKPAVRGPQPPLRRPFSPSRRGPGREC